MVASARKAAGDEQYKIRRSVECGRRERFKNPWGASGPVTVVVIERSLRAVVCVPRAFRRSPDARYPRGCARATTRRGASPCTRPCSHHRFHSTSATTRPSTLLSFVSRARFLAYTQPYTRRYTKMSKQPVEEVVYLEDLISNTAPAPPQSSQNSDAKASSQTSEKSVDSKAAAPGGSENGKSASTSGVKRQRTLVDMFSAAPSGSSKKLKKEGSGGTVVSVKMSASSSTAVVSGSQSLNSIPFSLSAYQEALSEQERQLLGLECETMGKSWYVRSSPCTRSFILPFIGGRHARPSLTAFMLSRRLKILKDEIRKPYFIKLKQFLWQQGVKGASDSATSLRIYPARKQTPQQFHCFRTKFNL